MGTGLGAHLHAVLSIAIGFLAAGAVLQAGGGLADRWCNPQRHRASQASTSTPKGGRVQSVKEAA